jgi:neutral ceramidase
MGTQGLQVGFGEANITPPTGLYMCGGLQPRTNVGMEDPLMVKALVATSGGKKVAVVGVDLIGLPRDIIDLALDRAAAATSIGRDAILISCSHTHSGPYTIDGLYVFNVTDADYLATLPGAIASAIIKADAALEPATMYIGRSAVYHYLHHRRVLNKDGKAINTWMSEMIDDLDRCPQLVGACGPIDPELWVVRFDRPAGGTLGFFVNFTLHVNTHFGVTWSADYPGVIAAEMRRVFGQQVTTVFAPGACANINTTLGIDKWRTAAEFFAGEAVRATRHSRQVAEPIAVDAVRRDLAVPRRDPKSQPAGAIERLDWGGGRAWEEVFEPMLDHVAAMPEALPVPVAAVRIGPFAVASNPGELFVEHGLHIKQNSPFPHTVVTELTNDLIMYQPTRTAFQQQGYETLVGANRVSVDGIEQIVGTAIDLLNELWGRKAQ